jgi:hypothetical protein
MKAFKKEIYWQCDLMAIKKSNVACVHRRNISQYYSGERYGPWASCLKEHWKSIKVFAYENTSICLYGVVNINEFLSAFQKLLSTVKNEMKVKRMIQGR